MKLYFFSHLCPRTLAPTTPDFRQLSGNNKNRGDNLQKITPKGSFYDTIINGGCSERSNLYMRMIQSTCLKSCTPCTHGARKDERGCRQTLVAKRRQRWQK